MTKITNITKRYKVQSVTLAMISWFCCFGVACIFIVYAFASGLIGANGNLETKLGTILYGFILSVLPLVAIAVLVKNKVKPLVYMADVIVANAIFGDAGLYTMFIIWIIDTYLITYFAARAHRLYEINREIDKR